VDPHQPITGSIPGLQQAEARTHRPGRITFRSLLVGTILAILHTAWLVYEETVWGHFGIANTATSLVPSVVGILFLLLMINSLLLRFYPRWALRPSELMVLFTMLTLSAVTAGFDLLQNLTPIMVLPFWFADDINRWNRFHSLIPSWFAPRDKEVLKGYFLGSSTFFQPEVMKAWAVPLIAWGLFLFVIAWTMLCLNTLMRRQWVDRERLTFPIVHLPILVSQSGSLGGLFHSRAMLVGFLLPVCIESMNVLSTIFPAVPHLQLNVVNVGRYLPGPPWSGANPIFIAWWPFGLGLAFLIPLDVSFSCWFFFLVRKLSEVMGVVWGWREPYAGFAPGAFPYVRELAYGAWIGLFLTLIWSARSQLFEILRKAFGLSREPDDSQEPISYRAAVAGVASGFLILFSFAIVSGMTPWVALLYFALYFLATVVMTRIYAQIGSPILELYFFNAESLLATATGSRILTSQDLVILTYFFWFNRCYRQHPMGHQLESLRFAEVTHTPLRQMPGVILGAAVIGIVVGLLATMQIYYTNGASTAKVLGSQMGVAWEAYGRLSAWADNPQAPQTGALTTVGISLGATLLWGALRNALIGFPLHPVGYAFAVSYAMEYFWAIFLSTWIVKALLVRYGGLKAYRAALPFFLGLIVGDSVTQVFWGLVAAGLGFKGTSPYLQIIW